MPRSSASPAPASAPRGDIVVYEAGSDTRPEARTDGETMWLTQSEMAKLFGCTVRNIRLHLENIYAIGELESNPTRKDFFLVRMEGSRQVSRTVTCYNLDAIISVGYRVNSIRGVRFRQWATHVLRDMLLRKLDEVKRIGSLEGERKSYLRDQREQEEKMQNLKTENECHVRNIAEAKADLAKFNKARRLDAEGNVVNDLVIDGFTMPTVTKEGKPLTADDKAKALGEKLFSIANSMRTCEAYIAIGSIRKRRKDSRKHRQNSR